VCQSNDSKESGTRGINEIRLRLIRDSNEYQSVASFGHETCGSRDGILNCDQHGIREGGGGNELSAGRINQSCSVSVGSTIAVCLDDFSKGTSCCWRDVDDFAWRGKLRINLLFEKDEYTAKSWNLTLGEDETRSRQQQTG
jgi:hypothetical protein